MYDSREEKDKARREREREKKARQESLDQFRTQVPHRPVDGKIVIKGLGLTAAIIAAMLYLGGQCDKPSSKSNDIPNAQPSNDYPSLDFAKPKPSASMDKEMKRKFDEANKAKKKPPQPVQQRLKRHP